MKDPQFLAALNDVQKEASLSFGEVTKNFLDNHKSPHEYLTRVKPIPPYLRKHVKSVLDVVIVLVMIVVHTYPSELASVEPGGLKASITAAR
ncbi:hypothetical protein EVAR_44906_1 [Eumeta japonica]|uniref:Uncharacterized protein n=1 Tax=Eumeta variegata TaxID=151549 RepID=A0A4C1XNK6_EUMVA|nr:hypothetical protein EVAR_44906_1 [Eumeta japonica]